MLISSFQESRLISQLIEVGNNRIDEHLKFAECSFSVTVLDPQVFARGVGVGWAGAEGVLWMGAGSQRCEGKAIESKSVV